MSIRLSPLSFGDRRGRSRKATTAVVSTFACGLLVSSGALLMSGCGGGSSNTNYQTTTVSTTIEWPARSRAINAPGSALSCIISLQSGNTTTGGSIDFPVINRDTSTTTAYTQTWTAPSEVRTGSNKVNVRFYAQPDGKGGVVADLTQAVTINSDGSGLGTLAISSKVASVTITPGQTVNLGGTGTVAFTAQDNTTPTPLTLALSTGSAVFNTTTSGGVTVSNGGTMTGTSFGATTITATVDGITSAPATVTTIVGSGSLTTTADGLGYRDIVVGSGAPAVKGKVAQVAYRLFVSSDGNIDSGNYTQVDPNNGSEGSFPYTIGNTGPGGLIVGFDEGVSTMAVGGTRLLVVPPSIGYGGTASPLANSTLIFVVRLIGVDN